jgi:hypothetical protein
MIRIFTIATNTYKRYITTYFLPTIHNFFKDYDKELIIFSDGLKEYDDVQYDHLHIKVKHIYNLYPFDIQFNKFNFIDGEIDCVNDDDLCFYIDSDTIFKESKKAEEQILKEYKDDKIICTIHPLDIYAAYFTDGYNEFRNRYTNEAMYGSLHFTPDANKRDLITSFIVFNKKSFKKFFEEYNRNIKIMMHHVPFICPSLNDEFIVIKMYHESDEFVKAFIYNTINFAISDNLTFENYIFAPWMNEMHGKDISFYIELNNDYSYIICNQKFNYELKIK